LLAYDEAPKASGTLIFYGPFQIRQKTTAKNMGQLAFEKFARQELEDIAYFVPNYLKEFKALQSTKNLLLKL
jgi:tRNA threonylcarbamoyladenosine biosynthesis protein TsaB